MDRLSAMETFVCVVETGSFSAAARRLEVGQPAVSKTVAQLEEHLGVRLLLRSTRGLTSTEAGAAFFERAKRAIEEASEAELAARGAGSSLTGTLRVCAAVTFARLHVLPHLGGFLALHPGLDIDVVLDDRSVNLVEEGIDVALRMGELSDSGLTARKIGECPRMVLGTPAYFEQQGEPTSPAQLVDHQTVIYSQNGGGTHWLFRCGDSEQAVTVSGRVRVSAAEGVRTAVLAHLGLAMSSEWMFAPELASGEVRQVLQDWQLPGLDLWAVFPSGRMASAKARAFVTYVEQLLANP
ncbi:LysR family transcriptional regulator [Pseudomonas gingeri]|uniref:LysR family transcriptional regulator n=1 Tax=Pseudomonas gingeri TaxID=117681 RepID=UPI0015A3D892|nr:LysR family transcriptional regulator [Pseudomonas gingeri]NWA24865.1 LysR family transcriptional regulator [Pseudomonas gingeri]NWD71695.1 LysR family transcriptional regulator [Pseudomonas gingeri]